MGGLAEGEETTIRGEFAHVVVSTDDRANGRRLRVEDRRSGRVVYLGAMELEGLTWLGDGDLWAEIVTYPSRW